jgi:N-acetylglutamate synthase-like GNAT family acetyltransferase
MSTPLVREATSDDLPRLVELLAQLSPDDPSREDPSRMTMYRNSFNAIAADPNHHLLVLEADGGIRGTLALIVIQNLSHRGAPFAIIENVVVDQEDRGKTYGETLMKHAIDSAREHGCYKVSLTSNKRRTDAHRFYERLGFQRTHEAFRLDL